ncbi:hypothetical protein ACH5RR_026155 [Cinchona calisaya]|uniref:Uncharacterized protein n=1 Tax=Cinchona calisaya TaxID=153742 RepID=A0ABD2Z6R0_9GENT
MPVILTKIIQISPRRKVSRHGMLNTIPEDTEIGKGEMSPNLLIRQRRLQITGAEVDDYESDGIGLGMCLGVGIGVGFLMRLYQATTRSFKRKFF